MTVRDWKPERHPVRRQVLQLLRVHGASTVGWLADSMKRPRSVVAYHVRVLEQSGKVERGAQKGRDRWVSIAPRPESSL